VVVVSGTVSFVLVLVVVVVVAAAVAAVDNAVSKTANLSGDGGWLLG
jgi:hypothetical protein